MSEEKIETCFLCGKKFDMNNSELAYYRNGKSDAVGFQTDESEYCSTSSV